MPLAGTAAITELWAKVKDGFGRKLSVSPASTTVDVKLNNDGGSTLSTGTIPAATASAAGVITAADKSKLDGIAAGATASAGTITGVTAAGELTGGGTSGGVTISHVTHLDSSEAVGELSTSDYALDWGGSFANAGFECNMYGHVTACGDAMVTLPSGTVSGATASSAGKKGLVPAPAAGDQGKWLRGDGSWAEVTPSGIGAAPLASPALTGTPTAPTASAGTSTTQIATTAFVSAAITAAKAGAATFQGTVADASALTGASYTKGMYWVVSAAGAYAGQACEVGDMVFCVSDKGGAYADSDFSVVQNNVVEMTAAEVDAICK